MPSPATLAVIRAVVNPGSHPTHHFDQLAKLRTSWPSLYYALMQLVREFENDAPELDID